MKHLKSINKFFESLLNEKSETYISIKDLKPNILIMIYNKKGDKNPTEDVVGLDKGPLKVFDIDTKIITFCDVDGFEIEIPKKGLKKYILKEIPFKNLKKYI